MCVSHCSFAPDIEFHLMTSKTFLDSDPNGNQVQNIVDCSLSQGRSLPKVSDQLIKRVLRSLVKQFSARNITLVITQPFTYSK